MANSYINAETYGIGELIAQRKRFRVPGHQRDYAWGDEEVSTFIEDVLLALEADASDYFIGLVVLIGPKSGVWEILDGQQRIATTTMLFSAIRQWLDSENFTEDAAQIEQQFIGIRELGKDPSPRLTLNVNDKSSFTDLVLTKTHTSQIVEFIRTSPRHSSSRLLAQAALSCRHAVEKFAIASGKLPSDQVSAIYRLAQFLENSVKVVCLEIGSDADAYMIFESLNFRGHDLSVLDLVKNHVYSLVNPSEEALVSEKWQSMRNIIVERNADDFLKVIWTSIFGRVQRGSLFAEIKRKYTTNKTALELANLLFDNSSPYVALEDPLHEMWASFPPTCSYHIATLTALRATQIRPVILSAINANFSPDDLEQLLWIMIVLTVRHQTIGKRRTGSLELITSKICTDIAGGSSISAQDVADTVLKHLPSDEEFFADFERYSEYNAKRVRYFLSAIESASPPPTIVYSAQKIHNLFTDPDSSRVVHIANKTIGRGANSDLLDINLEPELANRLGNWCLINSKTDIIGQHDSFANFKKNVAQNSQFNLTRNIELYETWDSVAVLDRQKKMAKMAVHIWRL